MVLTRNLQVGAWDGPLRPDPVENVHHIGLRKNPRSYLRSSPLPDSHLPIWSLESSKPIFVLIFVPLYSSPHLHFAPFLRCELLRSSVVSCSVPLLFLVVPFFRHSPSRLASAILRSSPCLYFVPLLLLVVPLLRSSYSSHRIPRCWRLEAKTLLSHSPSLIFFFFFGFTFDIGSTVADNVQCYV